MLGKASERGVTFEDREVDISHKENKAREDLPGNMNRPNIQFCFSALFSKQSLLLSEGEFLMCRLLYGFTLTHVLAFHDFPVSKRAESRAGKDSKAKLSGNLMPLLGSHLPHLAVILLTGGPGMASEALQLIVVTLKSPTHSLWEAAPK